MRPSPFIGRVAWCDVLEEGTTTMTRSPIVGVKIRADKEVHAVELRELADYQACVGGWIECVALSTTPGADDYIGDCWINEEGRIIGLPFNSIATDLCGRLAHPIHLMHTILGDVVVTGPVDDEGSSTTITRSVWDWIARIGGEAGWHVNSRPVFVNGVCEGNILVVA